MNFLFNLFNRPNIECPRCLGKGHVDWDDIKRLDKELQWRPGKCVYCNGKGKVTKKMIAAVAVDTTYLNTDLSDAERKRIFNKDGEALERAGNYDTSYIDTIKQIEYLHFVGKMEPQKIVDFYFIPTPNATLKEKEELLDYINKVIERKLRKN